jgi:outer membrane protein TolC
LAADARRRPSVGVFANYNLVDDENAGGPTSGDDQWWLGVSFTVPLWFGSYEAGDQAAASARLAATLDRLAIDDRIHADVAGAEARWTSARDQLALTDGAMAERAQQALEAEQADYGAGTGDFADVIAAWQQVLAIRLMIVRLRADWGQAEAELLQAVGATDRSQLNQFHAPERMP